MDWSTALSLLSLFISGVSVGLNIATWLQPRGR